MIKWPLFVIELFCNGILDFLDLLGLKAQKIQNAVLIFASSSYSLKSH